MTLRIAVDTKNLALYTGGIAGFFKPLLTAWVGGRPNLRFILVGPQGDGRALANLPNCEQHIVAWPRLLPRPLRHPFYDNVQFPLAIRRVRPDWVFSPYHDVRLPTTLPSVMMIHDTCQGDLINEYPWRVRAYYLTMLRLNLKRARHVLTVSEASRASIVSRYALKASDVSVVPNTLEPEFLTVADDMENVANISRRWPSGVRIFYPSGAEYRKNVNRLLAALEMLISRGVEVHLWTTGLKDAGWKRALSTVRSTLTSRIHFLGKLNLAELRSYYLAADVVVYPSLCEGFGRVCLEAMELGTPIACSDLPVLREVVGDYPVYFDPLDIELMANAIVTSAAKGRRRQPRHEPRYERESVEKLFLQTMDKLLSLEDEHA